MEDLCPEDASEPRGRGGERMGRVREERLESTLGTGREEGQGRVKGKTGLGLHPPKSPKYYFLTPPSQAPQEDRAGWGPGCGDTSQIVSQGPGWQDDLTLSHHEWGWRTQWYEGPNPCLLSQILPSGMGGEAAKHVCLPGPLQVPLGTPGHAIFTPGPG